MKATKVFTPGSFPSHTYVERAGERLEQQLRDAIDTPGQLTSLVGPSKSGKTVLVEKVVGQDLLITITGAGLARPDDIWTRVLDSLGTPASETSSAKTSDSSSIGSSVSAEVSAMGFGKVGTQLKADAGAATERVTAETYQRSGLQRVVKDIANSDYVLLIDDFHYMPRDVQVEAAKSLKEAVRLGIKICTASVVHRGDDVVRANPELRGRVRAVDLKYWSPTDLAKIANAGFNVLNTDIDPNLVLALVRESAGSPQLMQSLCLNTCFVFRLREAATSRARIPHDETQLRDIFEQTSASTDFRSFVDILEAGPRTRGTERKLYKFKDGTQGDVYRCVLKAVASDPPRLSFDYDDLMRRTVSICDGETPVGSSVSGTCLHMSRLALEKFPRERAIDWDENKSILDIPDPYLLFYMRWSGRLAEPE